MLTLRIIEYLFYRLANNGIDPYVLVLFPIDPAVWELENMLLPRNGKIDSRQLVVSVWCNCYYLISFEIDQNFNFLKDIFSRSQHFIFIENPVFVLIVFCKWGDSIPFRAQIYSQGWLSLLLRVCHMLNAQYFLTTFYLLISINKYVNKM